MTFFSNRITLIFSKALFQAGNIFSGVIIYCLLLSCTNHSWDSTKANAQDDQHYMLFNGIHILSGPKSFEGYGGRKIINRKGQVIYAANEGEELLCYGEGYVLKKTKAKKNSQQLQNYNLVNLKNGEPLTISLLPNKYKIKGCFSNGLALVEIIESSISSYDGFIDKSGQLKDFPKLEDAGHFHEGFTFVKQSSNKLPTTYYFINSNGKRVEPTFQILANDHKNIWGNYSEFDDIIPKGLRFSDGLANVNGYYINHEAKAIIDQDSFSWTMHFNEGLAAVSKRNPWGQWVIIDKAGTEQFKLPSHLDVEHLDIYRPWAGFSEGLMKVMDRKSGLFGFINRTGEIIIKPQFIKAHHFKGGFSAVQIKQDEWKFINKNGDFLDINEDGIPIFWEKE